MRAHRASAGFTLVEVIVVVALIAVASALLLAALPPTDAQASRDAVRGLAGELRYARAVAIRSGEPVDVVIDVRERRWHGAERRAGDLHPRLPYALTAGRLVDADGREREDTIRFQPDGSASGGRVVLGEDDAAWRIDVAWLTGQVRVERGEGRR